jgi:hypothetical protein
VSQSGPKRRPVEKHGRSYQPQDRRIRLHQLEKQSARKRLILVFGATVLIIISGLIMLGWYIQYYSPPRVKAAVVNDMRFSQGDLVKRVRMIQATQDYRGESGTGFTDILRVLYNNDIDVSLGPFNLGMVQMELLKQGASEYGINVTEKDIDRAIRALFTPNIPEGQEVTEDQLEREYQENYHSYLNFNRITEDDYRRLAEEQLYFYRMRAALSAGIPEMSEHVEVSWISLPTRPDPSWGAREKFTNVDQVEARLQNEDFDDVALEFAVAFQYADTTGYVGWVPKGAFPGLDLMMFGGPDVVPIPHNETSPAIANSGIYYFVRVLDGPKDLKNSERWVERLKDVALETWLNHRFDKGTSEGWVEVKYDSKIYAWATEQLWQTAQQHRGDLEGK